VARKPIAYLRNVSRWIWLLVGGGAVLFIAIALTLAALNPDTPANALVTWWNGWLFAFPAAMTGTGVYMSLRWWRCPYCRHPLNTKAPVPARCPRCGNPLST
jgi:hypothetical protein